jgi:hypothetical protein
LIESLRAPEFVVRTHAAYALKQIGLEAQAALPVWLVLLKDAHAHLRSYGA